VTPATKGRATRGRRRRPARQRPAAEAVLAPPSAPSVPPPEPAAEAAEAVLAVPEPAFVQRAPAPEVERPLPGRRRAVFFDVENTSRAEHIARVTEHLALDRVGWRTEVLAVGNWRVIGHETARLLAHHGAQLVHSAPAAGVRDWSDLRIAIASGVWLASARPGDVLEVVSDDRAFDAVGDVATSLGITFRRLSYRALGGGATDEAPVARAEPATRRPGRYRGGRGRRPSAPTRAPAPSATGPSRAPGAPAPEARPHTAPHDEVLHVVQDLIATAGVQGVTLDAVANALKARGFSRPPGSPRLITRLRRFKELALSRAGVITLAEPTPPGEAAPAPVLPEPAAAPTALARDAGAGPRGEPALAAAGAASPPPRSGARRRRRRRRGRPRGPSGEPAAAV